MSVCVRGSVRAVEVVVAVVIVVVHKWTLGCPKRVTLDSTWGLHVGLTFEQPFTLCEYWHRVKVTHTLGSK